MERIKLGEVKDCDVFANAKGFDVTFEIAEHEGVTNYYDNLVELADDIFIANGEIGYHRLKAIARQALQGIDVELDDIEKEILL